MSKYARKSINKLSAYVPGEQPRPGEKIIKLNTNENPYPPAPGVQKALCTFNPEVLRKYPQPLADTFRLEASNIFQIDPDQIITGNGSDEIIAMIFRTFVGPGDTVAWPIPTYSYYPCQAQMQEAKVVELPFDENFDLPEKLEKINARVFFIANPNAPSGTLIPPARIETFAKKIKGLVVVDEAYADFAQSNCLDLAKRLPNLLVMRTLSKSYSLAGLRFGFAFASKQIITDLLKVKDSYNCDAISIHLATQAIRDQKYLKANVEKIIAQRNWLTAQLRSLNFTVQDSQTNFIWAVVPKKQNAKLIYQQLKSDGILVRYFDKRGLSNGLRISIGKPAENRKLIENLKRIIPQ
ncbi:MAG: histidinol-phosphate transaminase [Phycisphaerae bacterium]|jgi:histidinol-phosphate aminotransferase|nr:histidinol-phosphate transaminase [Phycisphaerae bacterium]